MEMNTNARATTPMPLACDAAAIPAEARSAHFALTSRLFSKALLEKRVLPEGYAFRFGSDAFEEVARFIANERRCCPFVKFELEIPPGSGAVWLRLTGPAGTREFLDAEFPD